MPKRIRNFDDENAWKEREKEIDMEKREYEYDAEYEDREDREIWVIGTGIDNEDLDRRYNDVNPKKIKTNSFDLGKEKIENLNTKEQKQSKDKVVIDKAIQNKLSQKD